MLPAMQELERQLNAKIDLSPAQVRSAVAFLLDPEPEPVRKAALLRALASKGETAEEIAAFVLELLSHSINPEIDPATLPGPMLDVVGTGGDKLSLFNVSTTAMFILAAGSVCIVKHGNRGVTGKCGGADVLEALGAKITLGPADLRRCVAEVGVGFVFAPHYHPTFKAVGDARKLLAAEGQRSIFNLLGPLLNPARPAYQLVGVFDEKLVPVFGEILRQVGCQGAWVVHGRTDDGRGMDELSTLGINQVARLQNGVLDTLNIDPSVLGFGPANLADLTGGDALENAAILEGVLSGSIKGPKRDIAVFNAAAGFVITGKAANIAQGKALAESLIDRGAAHDRLRAFVDWC